MANLFISDSISSLEDFIVGDPIAQANKVISEKLQQSLEFAFNKTPTNAIGNLIIKSNSVQYTLAPGSIAPAGVKIIINGSGFPSGATTLSALSKDTDYSISSISVIVDSVAGTNFVKPVSTVTLNTNINVASSRMIAFGLNGFSIAAGDVNISLTGALSTSLGADSTGNVTFKTANFSNAGLSITYDTDPSSTATKLAQLYLKGSFALDSVNMSDPLTSAVITDFGFKTFAGTNLTVSPVHYFYGENLNITLSKLESVSNNATAADLLRAVFDGTSDTVFTSATVEIPEGFEKVEIQGMGGASVTANGLNNFIKGSAGNDTVDGASGIDTFTTQGKFARSNGVLNQDGSVSLTTKGGGVDRIANIETIQFSDKSVSITQTIDTAEITYSINRLSGTTIQLPEIKVGDGVVNFPTITNDWWGQEKKGLILSSGKWITGHNVKNDDNSYNFEVARFNADGTPDITFGIAGVTSLAGFTNTYSLVELTNGEVILSQNGQDIPSQIGSNSFGPKLWKIPSDGVVIDSSSNPLPFYDTNSTFEVNKLISDGQGGFFAIGGSSGNWNQGETKVFKFTSFGVLDSSFGNGAGIFSHDVSGTALNRTHDAVQDSLGRLYILSDGNYDNGVFLTRITASGEIDEGFGTKILGHETTNNPLGLAIDGNGNVLVAYYTSYDSIQIARILNDGSFDTSFGGGDGIVDITLSGYSSTYPGSQQLLSVDAKNRPVLAFQNSGNTEVIRFTSVGTVDKIFTSNGDFATGSWEFPRWVKVDELGNVFVGVTDSAWDGQITSYYSIVKFTESGLIDKKFDDNTEPVNYTLTNYDGTAVPVGVIFDTVTREIRVNENAATGNYFLTVIASRGELSDSKNFILNVKQDIQLLGGVGKDKLIGEAGNDTLSGAEGRDYLNGGEGNDYLDGGSGIDILIGGTGDDIYVVDTLRDVIIDQAGWDTIKSENLNEINLHRYRGIEAAEYTGTGAVTLIGSHSNNLLIGSSGSDNLTGKFGNDTLTGGDSADKFIFNAKLDANFNFDQITDFSTGIDKLVLDETIFTRLTNSVQDSNLVIGMDAQDSDDYLIYDSTTQTLYYDSDGSAFGAKVAFVQVVGINSLNSADFSVI